MDLSSYYDWVYGDKPYGQVQTPRPGTPPAAAGNVNSETPTTVGTKEQKNMARKQIVLRVQPDVNRAVRAAAKRAGVSINQYAETTLGRAAGVKATRAKK